MSRNRNIDYRNKGSENNPNYRYLSNIMTSSGKVVFGSTKYAQGRKK